MGESLGHVRTACRCEDSSEDVFDSSLWVCRGTQVSKFPRVGFPHVGKPLELGASGRISETLLDPRSFVNPHMSPCRAGASSWATSRMWVSRWAKFATPATTVQ